MNTRFAPTLLLAAALSACTLGPDYERPAAPANGYTKSAQAQSVVYGGAVAANWYALFRSRALDGLVREALAGNPDLEAARRGLLAAQNELTAVGGQALPQVQLGTSATRTHANGSFLYEPTQAFNVTANQFSIGPQLAYNLDIFGGIRRSIEAQAADTANSRDQALNTYITLVDQVVVTAFDYAAAQAQIDVTQSLIHEQQDQYELTRKLEDAGKISRGDTLLALTQYETTRASLPALQQARDAARNALARLCGRTPDQFQMPALALKDFALPARLPVSLPSALVRQRPDVLAAEDSLHAANARIGVATAARLPSLTISAQYAQQATKLNQLFTQPGGIWSFGVDAATPIFEGGTLAAREDEAKQLHAQAQAAYRSTVIKAFVEVADALDAVGHGADSYEAHNRALTAAAEDRELAVAQYRAGKIAELQVLTAEQQYQSAALSQVQADAQRFTDAAELFRSLGGGWWSAPADPAALPAAPNTHAAAPRAAG